MDPNQPDQSYDPTISVYSRQRVIIALVIGLVVLAGIGVGSWALWRHYHKHTTCQTTSTHSCQAVSQPAKKAPTKHSASPTTTSQNTQTTPTSNSANSSTQTQPAPSSTSTPAPTTPTSTSQHALTNTGPGDVVALFIGVSLVGYAMRLAYSLRPARKS